MLLLSIGTVLCGCCLDAKVDTPLLALELCLIHSPEGAFVLLQPVRPDRELT